MPEILIVDFNLQSHLQRIGLLPSKSLCLLSTQKISAEAISLKSAGTIVALVLTLPLAVTTLVMLVNSRLEPWSDIVVTYVLLFLVFSTSGITTAIYHALPRTPQNVFGYAFAGAIGSAILLASADFADSYFSGPGLGWIWPLAGIVLGAVFGTAFRATLYFTDRQPALK